MRDNIAYTAGLAQNARRSVRRAVQPRPALQSVVWLACAARRCTLPCHQLHLSTAYAWHGEQHAEPTLRYALQVLQLCTTQRLGAHHSIISMRRTEARTLARQPKAGGQIASLALAGVQDDLHDQVSLGSRSSRSVYS